MIREVLTLDRLRGLPSDEAAALLAARASDGGGAHDSGALAAWLELDPDHARAWSDAQRALAAFGAAEDDPQLQILRDEARRAIAGRAPAWRPAAAAAAALVVAAIGGGILLWSQAPAPGVLAGRATQTAEASQPRRYATARGLPVTYALADGSTMVLDAQSAVTVAFTGPRRDVQLLAGRANFDVAHDTRRPFAVRAGDREIVALGTRFDVRVDRRGVAVVLAEGRLAVNGPAGGVRLQAGQALSAEPGKAPVVTAADVQGSAGWRQGLLNFEDESLGGAAAEANLYSRDQQLVVADPRVKALRISGVFQAGDPERFARAVAELQPVKVVRRGPQTIELVAADRKTSVSQ